MAQHTEWCQNPRCPEKKSSSQIRGTKGKKYYQSSKAYGYGNGNFCTLNCYNEWSDKYIDRAIDNLGIRIGEPVKLLMESAWSKNYNYRWNNTSNDRNDQHYLENKLMGIKIPITEQQYNAIGWSNHDCMNLARLLQPKQSA
jgi:hypothetical protein